MSIEQYLKEVARIPDTFCQVVLSVYTTFTGYPEPNVCGSDDVIFITWESGHRYADIDVYPGGECEFFFLDKISDFTFEEYFMAGTEPSTDILYYMNLLTNI